MRALVTWTPQDEARIAELRRASGRGMLTEAERAELSELRRRETIEAFHRRKAYYARRR